MADKKNILILTSDAGFGHRSAANALKAAFEDKLNGYANIQIVNPIQDPDLPDLVKQIETGYDGIVTEDPTLYQLAYAATDAPVVAKLLQDVATTALNRTMKKIVIETKPDVILMPYPTYTQAVLRALEAVDHRVPVDVIVTDLIGVHKLWFHTGADITFVPTGHVYRQALDAGIDKTRVELTGLPVHPKFMKETRDPRTLRQALSWDQDKITGLIVGSPRSGQTAAIARLLDRSGLDLQVAAISGGDEEAFEELKATEWKGNVHIYGRTNNMPELMKASDFIICKAGGLIVTESLACGLPVILYEALPGQEVGNVRYVVESGAGVWSPGAIGVLATAYAWLTKGSKELEQCRHAAQRVGKPRAAYDIVDRVLRQISE